MRPRGLDEIQLAVWLATNAIMQEGGCWICPFGKADYPQVGVRDGMAGREGDGPMRVHVFMHRVVNVTDPTSPERPYVLHSCDVKRCINPAHLRAGTHLQNMDDARRNNRMGGTPRAPLADDDVRAIRHSTDSLSTLARLYGIDPSYASLIRNRKRMAHVPEASE